MGNSPQRCNWMICWMGFRWTGRGNRPHLREAGSAGMTAGRGHRWRAVRSPDAPKPVTTRSVVPLGQRADGWANFRTS